MKNHKKSSRKHIPLLPVKFRFKAITSALAVGFYMSFATPVLASEADEVSKLIEAQRLDQALARAEAYLAERPSDAQMRFLKGLILTERNKPQEAITVFVKLTEDFPELPEPYNNLAVLYASQGSYEKARESLEMAIRTHPSYATAYENLGDVYAKLASQSYDKALQLDGRNSSAKTKLSMVRNIVNDNKQIQPPTQEPVEVAVAKPNPEPTAAPDPKPDQENKATTVAAVPTGPISLPPITATTPSVSGNESAEAEVSATQTIGADRAVLDSVNRWAKAWSDQDMSRYLDSYSQSFVPPRGMSRQAWEQQRERRIVGKDRIRVEVKNPLITLTGDTAVVKFKQNYFSDRLNNIANKTLTLKLEGNQWRIIKEQVTG